MGSDLGELGRHGRSSVAEIRGDALLSFAERVDVDVEPGTDTTSSETGYETSLL